MPRFDEPALLACVRAFADRGAATVVPSTRLRFSGVSGRIDAELGGRRFWLVPMRGRSRRFWIRSWRIIGVRVIVPFPDLPCEVLVGDRRTRSLALERIVSGDACFDAAVHFFGAPPDVARAFLDPAAQGQILP